jgi:hypothetical protein
MKTKKLLKRLYEIEEALTVSVRLARDHGEDFSAAIFNADRARLRKLISDVEMK